MNNESKHPKIKLIALDMDGTLLNNKGEIPEENKQAIKEAQEQGIHVVLSTGRSLANCREHAESLLLKTFLVTVNGSEIWDTQGNLIDRNLVDVEHIQWLWELSQQHKAKIWANSCGKLWDNKMPEEIATLEWLKFGFHIEDQELRAKILNELQEKNIFEVTNSSPVNIEVNALGVNKARGLKTVCEKLQLDMSEVMAVGDSLNDMSMVTEAGWGVAMGNAQEVLKEAADAVTKTNEENGVAYAIRKWALQEEKEFAIRK